MKSRIKKIIIGTVALVFVTSGVSFAHDSDKRYHKSHKKTERHYTVKKHTPNWNNKHFKPWKHHRKQYRNHHIAGYYCEDGFYHYYDKRDRRWKNDHLKQRRHHRDRYSYKWDHRRDENYYRRHAPREDVVYKVALKDPNIVFKVIRKDR
jgi:hypothetical protein